MKTVEILGANCGRCRTMEESARAAAARLGIECEIHKVTDPMKFIAYGITAIPTVVVDGRVLVSGRVPALEEMDRSGERRAAFGRRRVDVPAPHLAGAVKALHRPRRMVSTCRLHFSPKIPLCA